MFIRTRSQAGVKSAALTDRPGSVGRSLERADACKHPPFADGRRRIVYDDYDSRSN
ncbi:hypothetical protein [Natronorubrum aibiense]|uniref:hypothetical protein n=1 Tax=Natronorubrum aibiense TaxID=348826 RepID=UPI00128F20A8|nr:hypothetical protein [Natronorubrum aibiense]